MINWIEVDKNKYYKEYYTDEVVAINDRNDALIGYLSPRVIGGLVCEYGDVMLQRVKYYAPVEELLKTLPNKKEELLTPLFLYLSRLSSTSNNSKNRLV